MRGHEVCLSRITQENVHVLLQGLLSMVMGGGLPPAEVVDFLRSNGSGKLTDQASFLTLCASKCYHTVWNGNA